MPRRRTYLRHATLIGICAIRLLPLYWVLKTAVTNENIYAYPPRLLPEAPHLFNCVAVWYFIPFHSFLVNSFMVSASLRAAHIARNAIALYALAKHFPAKRAFLLLLFSCMLIPFQATIIPAYLITSQVGLLNSYRGLAFPLLSTIVCIFVFKAAFEAVPQSLIDAARIDGLTEWHII